MSEQFETCSDNSCKYGHIIMWAGDQNYRMPEGYPCACGQTFVRYEVCPTCGHEKRLLVPKGKDKKP